MIKLGKKKPEKLSDDSDTTNDRAIDNNSLTKAKRRSPRINNYLFLQNLISWQIIQNFNTQRNISRNSNPNSNNRFLVFFVLKVRPIPRLNNPVFTTSTLTFLLKYLIFMDGI